VFGLLRALFFGALALVALIPVAIVLSIIGLPVVLVLGLLALPVLLVLFLIGLPIFIMIVTAIALMGATLGVVMAFLAVGVVALKIAFVVLVPLLVLGWIVRRVFGPPPEVRLRG
jgi:hypothetical protein